MIWTNKGLKQRIAELEAEVTSLNVQLKESIFEVDKGIELSNMQHFLIMDLYAKIESLTKTSPNVVVPLETPKSKARTLGQNISRALRKKP